MTGTRTTSMHMSRLSGGMPMSGFDGTSDAVKAAEFKAMRLEMRAFLKEIKEELRQEIRQELQSCGSQSSSPTRAPDVAAAAESEMDSANNSADGTNNVASPLTTLESPRGSASVSFAPDLQDKDPSVC